MIIIWKRSEVYGHVTEMIQRITWQILNHVNSNSNLKNSTNASGTSDLELALQLKYLSNFWRALNRLLNCETNFILTWWANCVISPVTGAWTISITDTKPHVTVVTLSSQEAIATIKFKC